MSHPYWPQSYYLFRPGGRRSQAPVPASMSGLDDFSGGRYETVGTPAPRSWRRGVRTYGSMTPKYDYATPRYIRDEPSGMGEVDSGAIAQSVGGSAGTQACLGGLQEMVADTVVRVMDMALSFMPGVFRDWFRGPGGGTDGWAKGKIFGAFDSLQNYTAASLSDPQKRAAAEGQITQALMTALSWLPDNIGTAVDLGEAVRSLLPQSWTNGTWKGAVANDAAKAVLQQIADCVGAGEATAPSEGLLLETVPAGAAWSPIDTGGVLQMKAPSTAALTVKTTGKFAVKSSAQAAAECQNAGGVFEYDQAAGRYYCKPGPALTKACLDSGGQPYWDPVGLYKCVGGAGAAKPAGAGDVALIAGGALLLALLLKG